MVTVIVAWQMSLVFVHLNFDLHLQLQISQMQTRVK